MTVSPAGSGNITSPNFTPAPTTYPAYFSCNYSYSMTAEPGTSGGYVFGYWTVQSAGASETYTVNPLNISMTDGLNKVATAHFTVPEPENIPPNADAGDDQIVSAGDQVTLDASGSSDPDDGIRRYRWQQTSGAGVTISDASAEKPTFTAPAVSNDQSILIFQLMVEDQAGAIDTDTVTITIHASGNLAPTADAGEDQTVTEGDLVTLDGSASFDPDGNIQNYHWQQTTGASITLSDASAQKPTFTAPEVYVSGNPLILVFKLAVTDKAGDTAEDYVTITIFSEDSVSGGGCFISGILR